MARVKKAAQAASAPEVTAADANAAIDKLEAAAGAEVNDYANLEDETAYRVKVTGKFRIGLVTYTRRHENVILKGKLCKEFASQIKVIGPK